MAAPQNFRSAFNGFNREDVVHYLEYINAKHTNLVNQLTAENQELRAAMQQPSVEDQSELVAALQAQCAELTAQLEEAQAHNADMTEKLETLEARCQELEARNEAAASAETVSRLASEELEAYRRAERIEREAKERAELVYFQANGVLTKASATVDTISADITDMADQVMQQLTQLQIAVSSSKQALQDASSIMSTIRPNK